MSSGMPPQDNDSLSSPFSQSPPAASSLPMYETKTLMCKNNCGYYGNSIQYNGYCSICFRQINQTKTQNQPASTRSSGYSSQSANSSLNFNSSFSLMNSSVSFDDSTSLLHPSQSFSNDDKSKNSQIWNEHQNLSKFSAKPEKRRNSTFKLFRRSNPPAAVQTQAQSNQQHAHHSNTAPSTPNQKINLVDKVADLAANLVDQSLSLTSSPSSASLFGLIDSNQSNFSMADFNTALNKLVCNNATSPTANTDSRLMFGSSFNIIDNGRHPTQQSATLNAASVPSLTLAEFEKQFQLAFSQLYGDLIKQLKQFLDKFLDVAYRGKDPNSHLVNNINKQSECIQEFYKKIYKYIQTNATIKSFVNKLNAYRDNLNAETSKQKGGIKSNNNVPISNGSNESIADSLYEAVMIMVESFVNNYLYDYVFPAIMGQFEEQDMMLQKKIRSFYWITNEMIGTCIDESSIFYRDSYEEALNYIVEMDSKRTSFEKMICITECSKNIFKALNTYVNISRNISESSSSVSLVSSPVETTSTPNSMTTTGNEEQQIISIENGLSDTAGDSNTHQSSHLNNKTSRKDSSSKKKAVSSARSVASADDFLPAFIYIVLKANPTMLYSNINFITLFSFEKRILQGEHAYHFCSLNAVIAHIENLNANHLNMSQDEFENYCNGLADADSSGNVLKLIQFNLKMLSELKDKQKIIRKETIKLQTDMSLFRELMHVKFNACLNNNKEKYTKNIEGFVRKPSALDDSQDVMKFNQSGVATPALQPVKASESLSSLKEDQPPGATGTTIIEANST